MIRMKCMEYVKLKNGNRVNEDSWEILWHKLAFIEFDAALEEYVENEKEKDNGGDSLMDVSVNDVECIIDEYLNRTEDMFRMFAQKEMRNAIQTVTGLIC